MDLKEGSKAREIYGVESVEGQHRHRYEFNEAYREKFEDAGMIATGINPANGLVEIVEIRTSLMASHSTQSTLLLLLLTLYLLHL